MGRGDKKSKKGKIAIGSYGNTRRRNTIKAKLKRGVSRKVSESGDTAAEAPAKTRRAVKKKSEG